MYPQDFLFIFHGFLCVLVYGSSISHTRRGLGAGVTQVVDFDCPEEFGYYPHPTDCTQYYVCVFGGALLESCTGGLMYSHELQTCDWPRNVGCGENGGSDGGTISTVRVTDPRTRTPQQSSRPSTSPQQSPIQVQPTRSSHRQDYNRAPQEEVLQQQQLYAEEDLGPADEVETDRQQRVYRGQPSTIGQVQRDRDGLRPLKSNVHGQNIIPAGPGAQDKISVVSFGSQRPSAPRPQEQYRDGNVADEDADGTDDRTETNPRTKRQAFARPGRLQTNPVQIPVVFFSGAENQFAGPGLLGLSRFGAVPRVPLPQAFPFGDNKIHLVHPAHEYYQPQSVAAAVHQHHPRFPQSKPSANATRGDEELARLTKSTIQSEFRPIRYSRPTRDQTVDLKTKYIESAINPLGGTQVRAASTPPAPTTYRPTTWKQKPPGVPGHKFFSFDGFVRVTTAKPPPRKNGTHQQWYGPAKTVHAKHHLWRTTTERYPGGRPSPRPSLYGFAEKPKDYDLRWLDSGTPPEGKRNATAEPGIIRHHKYVQFAKPPEYEYGEEQEDEEEEPADRAAPTKPPLAQRTEAATQSERPASLQGVRGKNMTFFDFIDELGLRDGEEIKAAFKSQMLASETTTRLDVTDQKFYVPEEKVNLNGNGNANANANRGWKRPVRFQATTERPRYAANQIEAPRKKIPEEYYENFKPFPTKSLYLTRRPDDDADVGDGDGDVTRARPSVKLSNPGGESRVEQVQVQLTSALPPLSPSPRPIERYNTSQRFQPSQFDQFYAVYDDDVDIYKSNDYGQQQQYQSPSSTPSSNIASQYRGQTTYKQSVEDHPQEPVQQQQHRNTYAQDLYSPPPVLQDYNDQYNVQVDDQQYQHIGQPTLKPSSRSETTNASKDALTESSTPATRVENVTTKTETAPIIRRSDSNSYFSISSFGPSTVLLPPVRFTESTPKFPEATFPPAKSEKPLFQNVLPSFRDGRNNFDPPKNGGALAKTFNSFDALLSSFLGAVTKSNPRGTPAPAPSAAPPTPLPPKTSPETIVRSEIGRIHHEPIVITENFKIRQPAPKKPEAGPPENKNRPTSVLAALPSPSSTPLPPPKLSQNDYLAYFVEIEPKKPKKEEAARGFLLTTPDRTPETTTEPKIVTKDNPPGLGQSDQVAFGVPGKNRPFNSFVRIVPNSQTQNVQLGATLDLEPVGRPQEKKKVPQEAENDTIEKQRIVGPITTVSRQPFQPVGKWVIAKNERPQQPLRFAATPKANPFDVYSQERPADESPFGAAKPDFPEKERQKEPEGAAPRGRGNLLQIHESPVPELRTGVPGSPYKFLLVDLDSTTEQLSTPAPFSRNPENEERNRVVAYKTNPEARVRPRYFDNASAALEEVRTQSPFLGGEPVQVPTESTTLFVDTDDRIKFSYKTNPESRFRNRFAGADERRTEDVEITPKIIVPEAKPEEKPTLVLEETPIRVLPQEEPAEPETPLPKRRKPEFRPKNVDVEPSSPRKPTFRYRSTTESAAEEISKPPRRVVKIHRNDLKNQRLWPNPKLKRVQKPGTRPPTAVLEDLEEKTLAKENEIHPTYRPIVVADGLDAAKNGSRFRFTVEDARDFADVPDNRIRTFPPSERVVIDAAPRGFERPGARQQQQQQQSAPGETENDVPEREPPASEKPPFPSPKRPPTPKNATLFENRATTKASRGKFKPSESFKLRLRPTTASPDSETTPGPHLTTRQPGGYTVGSTGNEVAVNRATPSPNRGTRPTLKPSTAIVSKASDFIDIYRFPPSRPQNLYATPTPDKSAAKCRKDVCLLPDCSCGGKDIPGGYGPEEIPQLVLLTFDDSVNDLNKGLYQELFERGRVNPNGCPISATFYVSHEWTDYSQVQNLYANGHEIASHSITHSFGEQFSQKKWTKEIAGQREILAAYGGVRLEDIRGMRAPFLAVGGNKMFKMLYDSNFTYDSSMPIYENRPPSWPYTLDYKLFHDCMIPPCPTKSYPGVWEVPMVMWQDLNGGRCSMGDACSNPPTADGVYKMLIKNFERHFTTNRAPFGLYYHAAWFTHEHHKEGFIAFLDTIVNMPEVWLVTTWQAIEWVRDPQPLSTVQNFPPFQCNVEKAKKCNNPKVCNLWHKTGVRYMRTCQPCPDVYPWTGKTGVKNSRVDNDVTEE